MLPLSKPSITDLEKEYVYQAMSAGDIGVGPFIQRFEDAWADWNDMTFGVSCNSGTNAIYLALKALGIGPGDEVIVPEYTMVATAWAVTYTGATPVFVDCDDDLIARNWTLTDKTKAIITVPIYGRSAPIPKLGVPVIEDMAEAHGIKPQGDIACYSFYGNKILTTGEGGMCLTDNAQWADSMRLYANMFMNKDRTMLHPKVGHNFRLTNLQAAVGLAQVERVEEILYKRDMVQRWYDENLPEAYKMPPREVLWMYDIQCKDNEKMKALLEINGIPTRYGFKPMSQQLMYAGKPITHLNAYKWSKRILYLPTYTDLTEKEVKKICQKISSLDEN